jgi:hypothetical protein
MAIEYTLYENDLTPGLHDFRAQVVNPESVNQDEILANITNAHQGISQAEALSFLQALEEELLKQVSRGRDVHMKLFSLTYSITGAYQSGQSPQKGSVRVRFHPDGDLQKAVANMIPVKSTREPMHGEITSVYDVRTGISDWYISPSHDIRLVGRNIQVHQYDRKSGDPWECYVEIKQGAEKRTITYPDELRVNFTRYAGDGKGDPKDPHKPDTPATTTPDAKPADSATPSTPPAGGATS